MNYAFNNFPKGKATEFATHDNKKYGINPFRVKLAFVSTSTVHTPYTIGKYSNFFENMKRNMVISNQNFILEPFYNEFNDEIIISRSQRRVNKKKYNE